MTIKIVIEAYNCGSSMAAWESPSPAYFGWPKIWKSGMEEILQISSRLHVGDLSRAEKCVLNVPFPRSLSVSGSVGDAGQFCMASVIAGKSRFTPLWDAEGVKSPQPIGRSTNYTVFVSRPIQGLHFGVDPLLLGGKTVKRTSPPKFYSRISSLQGHSSEGHSTP